MEARAREADLLVTHKTALLGPFEGVVQKSDVKFERGFVAVANAVKKLPAHPFTRLLRRVNFGYQGFDSDARFDSLEEAVGPQGPFRAQLAERAPRLRSWNVFAEKWKALLKSIALVPLESLTLRHVEDASLRTMIPELFAIAPRLSSLELDLGEAVALGPLPSALRSLTLHIGRLHAVLTRAEAGWEADLQVGYYAQPDSTAKHAKDVLALIPAQSLVKARLDLREARRDGYEVTVQTVRKATPNAEILRKR